MPAEPIQQPTYQSMQFNGLLADVQELVGAMDAGLHQGLLIYAHAEGRREPDGSVHWRIRLKRPDDSPEMLGEADVWVVVASTGVIRVLDDAAYRSEFNVSEGV